MKVYKPETTEGFLLQLKRILDDIESEKIAEYQNKHKGTR